MILVTNAVSALFLGDPSLARVLAGTNRHHLPTVVVGEYRYGSKRDRKRNRLEGLLTQLVSRSIVLAIEISTTPHYARVRDDLRRRGTPIPENDVWTAALAVQHDLAIVSRDEHFDSVSGLVRLDW